MVLTKSELVALLQKEVRLLLHLTTKIDPDMLDYRPTSKQRSTIELLRYLTTSGPALISYAKGQPMDADAIAEVTRAANARDFDETVAALAGLPDVYAELLADMSDDDFRGESGSREPAAFHYGSSNTHSDEPRSGGGVSSGTSGA